MTLSQTWSGSIRLLNVLPMTPVMLAEYVPADFDAQQRQSSEEALAIVARESGIEAARISSVVRQGGIYHEILEEAVHMKADLIVMTSHRPAMRTYFLGSNAGHVVRYAKCSVLVVQALSATTNAVIASGSEAIQSFSAVAVWIASLALAMTTRRHCHHARTCGRGGRTNSQIPRQLGLELPVDRVLDLAAGDPDVAQGVVVELVQRLDGGAALQSDRTAHGQRWRAC